ncbi:hypothetical protein SH467x_003673 [Pirellulaceae bacterium SH467]
MKMHSTYGIFDDEADHLIAMVRSHAPLDSILATPCPACGTNMVVSFNDDGTGFELSCRGDPLHMTTYQQIANPPPWWQQCYEQPNDTTCYWREWHSFDDNGTLHMKISGWRADDVRWSGELECPRDHRDYDLWGWILNESGCTKYLISDTDLDELRTQYENAK